MDRQIDEQTSSPYKLYFFTSARTPKMEPFIINFTFTYILELQGNHKGCPESIQPFWISWGPVAWSWCNLAASQRRLYCSSMNSHSPVGLISRQWNAVDWAYVLCDLRIHNDWSSKSASSRQCACPFYSSRAGFFFWQSITSPRSVSPPTAQIWLHV